MAHTVFYLSIFEFTPGGCQLVKGKLQLGPGAPELRLCDPEIAPEDIKQPLTLSSLLGYKPVSDVPHKTRNFHDI